MKKFISINSTHYGTDLFNTPNLLKMFHCATENVLHVENNIFTDILFGGGNSQQKLLFLFYYQRTSIEYSDKKINLNFFNVLKMYQFKIFQFDYILWWCLVRHCHEPDINSVFV